MLAYTSIHILSGLAFKGSSNLFLLLCLLFPLLALPPFLFGLCFLPPLAGSLVGVASAVGGDSASTAVSADCDTGAKACL